MTFDDSKIQLPIHCRLYRQEERAAARCEGVKAMDFVLPYTECNVLKLHHILVYGVEREKRLRCISPREDVKHHFKAPPTPPRATPLSFPLSVSRLG